VAALRTKERAAKLDRLDGYEGYDARVKKVRAGLLDYLARAKKEGRKVAAYGAAAKGNTLLNYCGVGAADIAYVVDRNPAKQGTLLPGSRIPVRPVEALHEDQPDDILILPWNIKDEVVSQLADLKKQGVRFLVAIPELAVVG
ncbi:MAG: methyltransferase C-terminal domain-containing protein, partial [Parvularculaceae bacterium]